MDLNIETQMIQCLERNIPKNSHDLRKDILDIISKIQSVKEKEHKLNFLPIKQEIKHHFFKS